MEKYCYETVQKISEPEDVVSGDIKRKDDRIPRKYLLRQVLVCSGVWSSYFCFGLTLGAPTVFIPQLRQEANSTDAVSIEMASWLSSAFKYSAIVNVIILAILARQIGRKLSFVIVCITELLAYLLLYYSGSITQILIGEVMLGPLMASPLTISTMVITEYVSPCYRGVFLTLKSATLAWGLCVANSIGSFWHWKNIAMLAFVLSMYSLITTVICPESPYWLANKNRWEDCAKSHRWLKGTSKKSEAELETLIQSQKLRKPTEVTVKNFYRNIITMFKSKCFYKPMLLMSSIVLLYDFTGKMAYSMYSIDIIKRITGKQSTAYTGMLILDGVTVLGMYVGCGLSTIVKRRPLLLVSSTVGVTFSFCLSIYLYLVDFNIISESTILSISLLVGYSLAISAGPMIVAPTVWCELTPVKYRSSTLLLLGCFGITMSAIILKITPFLLKDIEVSGTFLLFALFDTIFIFIIYKVVPETKDKTILEIQENLLKCTREELLGEESFSLSKSRSK